MDEVLVASLILDLEKRGRRAGKGFLSATLQAVAVAVSEACATIVSSENVRSRFKTLKRDYIAMKAALDSSGFGITWDDGAKYINADSGAWDDYVKSHPEAKGLRHKCFPQYDNLAIICGVDNATGDGMFSGHDPRALPETRRGTPLEGVAAGALAAAVTTPLDVVKTQLQCQKCLELVVLGGPPIWMTWH